MQNLINNRRPIVARQPHQCDRLIWLAMRRLGALAILAVGAVHLQQYIGDGYQAIPTIGPLFLLNAIGSAIVGVALLLPLERLLTARRAHAAIALLAVGAAVIGIGSLVALFISESGSLFGFSEHGYRAAIVFAIVAEGATLVLLFPVAAVRFAQTFSTDDRRRARVRETTSASARAGSAALPE